MREIDQRYTRPESKSQIDSLNMLAREARDSPPSPRASARWENWKPASAPVPALPRIITSNNKKLNKELKETGKLAKKILKRLQAEEKQVREMIDKAYNLSTPKQTIDLLNSLIFSYREYELKKGELRDDEVYGSIWTNNELDRDPLDAYGGNKKNKNKKLKKVRKHKGIVQTGGKSGKLKKGYKYSGKKLKNGSAEIVKVNKN